MQQRQLSLGLVDTALVLCVVVVAVTAGLDSRWEIFKAKYNKKYSLKDENARSSIWRENVKKIDRHNELFAQGKIGFYLAENEYSDMTHEEMVQTMNGFKGNRKGQLTGKGKVKAPSTNVLRHLPKAVDWRKKGFVTAVKNQGPCGSCWAFAATGGMEGQHFNASGKLVSLSESNLLDCSERWGTHGCKGGFIESSYQYVIDNGGIDTEKSYPYDPSVGSCYFTTKDIGAQISRYVSLPHGDERSLQVAVATVGPVSVAIDASHDSFSSYGGGIYNEPKCSAQLLDHAVLVVGYGVENGTEFWLVKNSWGTSWGEQGYIRMSRFKNNQCGIASMASYPLV